MSCTPLLAFALQVVAPADLVGAWSGEVVHAGRSTLYALEIEPGVDGKLAIAIDLPAIHVLHQPLGEFAPKIDGERVELGWLGTLRYDAAAQTLKGVVPAVFAPVYELEFTLKRVDALALPERKELDAPLAEPLWTFDLGAPAWPGPTFVGVTPPTSTSSLASDPNPERTTEPADERGEGAAGSVLVGADDGRLVALAAASGVKRWEFATGGRLRSRATLADGAAYVHSDDGCVYRLDVATGTERWRVRVETEAVVRLPFDDPKSRYDRFGSEVTSANGTLYVGTHAGRVLALDPKDGRELWSFTGAECVLAAPAVDARRVVFGGWDGCVRALDVKTGKELWRRDTQKPVVSTPALVDERVIVGGRSYDLFGLDAATGAVLWQHYVCSRGSNRARARATASSTSARRTPLCSRRTKRGRASRRGRPTCTVGRGDSLRSARNASTSARAVRAATSRRTAAVSSPSSARPASRSAFRVALERGGHLRIPGLARGRRWPSVRGLARREDPRVRRVTEPTSTPSFSSADAVVRASPLAGESGGVEAGSTRRIEANA